MDVSQATARFAFLPVRLQIVPQQVLKLPALSQSNTLRGAFGVAFRRLVCIPQCREARLCPLSQTCPYRIIIEPAPPPVLFYFLRGAFSGTIPAGKSQTQGNQDIG
jgi:hypothetical protein